MHNSVLSCELESELCGVVGLAVEGVEAFLDAYRLNMDT